MRRHLAGLLGALLILAGLLGAAAAPVAAANEPAVATPQTLHYHAEVTLLLAGQGGTSIADGDFDLVHTAFHLTVLTQVGALTDRTELIVLNGRLYTFNPDRNRWEYRTLGPAELATAVTAPKVLVHPTASYRQMHTATIDGVTTSHWQASGDYNLLTPAIIQGQLGGIFVEETFTTEAFIGLDDGYLHRQIGVEDGTMTGLGATAQPPAPASSKATYDYSNFDQPVTIVAPEGAVPAGGGSNGGPTGPPGGSVPGLIARLVQLGLPLKAETLSHAVGWQWSQP